MLTYAQLREHSSAMVCDGGSAAAYLEAAQVLLHGVEVDVVHHHEVAVVGADDELAEVGRQAGTHQAVGVEDAGALGPLIRATGGHHRG